MFQTDQIYFQKYNYCINKSIDSMYIPNMDPAHLKHVMKRLTSKLKVIRHFLCFTFCLSFALNPSRSYTLFCHRSPAVAKLNMY